MGLVEWMTEKMVRPFYLANRLDKETTGLIPLPEDKESARRLTGSLQSGSVKKTYLFITDRKVDFKKQSVRSDVQEKSAHTDFEFVKGEKGFSLWKAFPKTGRTHQIRVHASEIGIPILGDSLYGGTDYPVLFLHCQSMESSELDFKKKVDPPLIYSELELLENPEMATWVMSFDRRERLFCWEGSLRMIHSEGDPLRCDKYGDTYVFAFLSKAKPRKEDIDNVKKLCELKGIRLWHFRWMPDRGKDPNASFQLSSDEASDSWSFKENKVSFVAKMNQGQSPGLFLDQRNQRKWVQDNSSGKRVLNLFSYTGGFSLNAAIGGADSTVSVDYSKNYIDWTKENFNLNELSQDNHEYWSVDALRFLKGAQKHGRQFDIIICDPPSFARMQKQTFEIERDYPLMLKIFQDILSPGGHLLLSCNYEKWSFEDFKAIILSQLSSEFHVNKRFLSEWDFELTNRNAILKSLLLGRRCT